MPKPAPYSWQPRGRANTITIPVFRKAKSFEAHAFDASCVSCKAPLFVEHYFTCQCTVGCRGKLLACLCANTTPNG
eukprot:m.115162 g.115162  ORF g.115162 m.115162 type:complete len:76 (-) comp13553_c0_seq10:2-229(-)